MMRISFNKSEQFFLIFLREVWKAAAIGIWLKIILIKSFFLSLSFSVILSFHSFSCSRSFSFSKYFFCFLSLSHTFSLRNLTFLFSITIKIQRYDDTQFKKCKDQKRKVLIGLCCSNFKVFSQEPTSFGLIISRYLCHTYADTLFNGAQTWK